MLSGLDLINELAAVLPRFRVGPLSFMTDKKTMFYQVKTPENRDHSDDPYCGIRLIWIMKQQLTKITLKKLLFLAVVTMH